MSDESGKTAKKTATAQKAAGSAKAAEPAKKPGAPRARKPSAQAAGASRARVRVDVLKTYKLFIGGKFPRSESGRVYEVTDSQGDWLANAPRSSRKDARDAVVAARKAFGGWSAATAYNRGQILYRIAEMLEGRRAQFTAEVAAAEGLSEAAAAAQVDATVDRWVWYAGWSDKVAQVAGGANPVAGPFFNLSTPEPTGVVAVLAPQESSFLGLVSVLAPVIVTGNTAVLVPSERAPLPALSLGEVLATSDLPGGVVNVLSGRTGEVAATLASHQDVNAIDLAGAAGDPELAKELETSAADNLKRVRRPGEPDADWAADPGTSRLLSFLETKTVWHPMGV
ncbi:aldehyde dehydrogenase family protein [Streptomyces ovatisporus]|uniref:Aldehyde dehydrogenase family protein n=1 Tax=Streptomyces ovatisporus TaxID=1128682 RepID=A0ABV9A1D8_9ACTN